MFLFYSDEVNADHLMLRADEHHHCSKVLRKNKGDVVHVTDGQGHIFHCHIEVIKRDSTQCLIFHTESHNPVSPLVSVAIAPVKNFTRMEWFVEKATEMGVSDIYIVKTQRAEKKNIKKERLDKIAVSAMKQSLKAYLPTIAIFESLSECLEHTGSVYKDMFIGYCEEKESFLSEKASAHRDTLLFIGPEGDFTPEEIDNAVESGVIPVSLGQSRLRSETAGLVALLTLRLKSQTI